jgi:hypothetical protein
MAYCQSEDNCNNVSIFGAPMKKDFIVQLKQVRLATTANIVSVYNANTLTVAAPLVIDGINVEFGDRILIKNQTNPIENGVYKVIQNGLTDVILSRTCDFKPMCYSSKIVVGEGATLANTLWFNYGYCQFMFNVSDVIFLSDGGSGSGSFITDAANLGGGAEVFAQKNVDILEFRTLEAGTDISIVQNLDTITINATGASGSSRILFDINNVELYINNSTYLSAGNMPWDNSEYSGYTNGQLTFYAEINDHEIEVEVFDVVNTVVLGSITTSGSGAYTTNIINPLSDTYIVVNVRNDSGIGTNYSRIFGIVISFLQ